MTTNRRAFLLGIASAAIAANVPVAEYVDTAAIQLEKGEWQIVELMMRKIREAQQTMADNIASDIFSHST